MKPTLFTDSSYSRLYYSLIRFTDMKRGKAICLVRHWASANHLSYCNVCPGSNSSIPDLDSFSRTEFFSPRPYFTEVQLYKSLQSLYKSIDQSILDGDLLESVLVLRCLISDIAYRFWHSYGMEIESEDTVYSLCNDSLDPYSIWEPTTCLWNDCLAYQKLDLNPFQEVEDGTFNE